MDKDCRIGIVGHFGGTEIFLDGQTVKTKTLLNELVSAGYKNIVCVDTYYNQSNKVKLLWDSIKCILSCKVIIMLLSRNGMKIYFPMMYYAKKILRRKVYHDVIGGNLASYVKSYPKYAKYLDSYDGNWVEFHKMKNQLEDLGIHNCIVIPNFKRLDTSAAKMEIADAEQNAFCMFSRVTEAKGVTEAICAVNKYNKEHETQITLNIWGPVDEAYKEEFEKLLETSGQAVVYQGCVDYSESVSVLTNHLALLFPTHWDGEGFPGTIVDAYSAGVPVIASDWNANAELVDNFQTGWIYPNGRLNSLYESIEWAVQNKSQLVDMRKECVKKALNYTPEMSMKTIKAELEKK